MSTLAESLINLLYIHDVELTEDLKRRLPCTLSSVNELSNFFHLLLAQYQFNTLDIRAGIPVTDDFNEWFTYFRSNVLPTLIKFRLPTFTHINPAPIY